MTSATHTDAGAIARRYQALSDPTRLRILEMLAGGERCVCELTAAMGVAQSRLSFHLKSLREVGLLKARRSGRWIYYSVDLAGLAQGKDYLEGLARKAAEGGTAGHVCLKDGSCCQ